MRKSNRNFYKWVAFISVIVFLSLQHLKTRLSQQTYRKQTTESTTVEFKSVDLSAWSMTSVYPKLVNSMADSQEQKSVLNLTERYNNESKIVQGQFFESSFDNGKHLESKSWLTVYPARGRLGNHMFQLASLIGTAHKFGFRPFISSSTFDIDSVFNVPKIESLEINLNEFNEYQERDASTFAERDITHYTDLSALNSNSNWTLDGYFQSFKHFEHITNEIKRLFTFKEYIVAQAESFIQTYVVPGTVKVGIHVRRGDFLSDYHMSLGRVTPGLDYYQRAMDFYTSQYDEVAFFVFSNDIVWCKENLRGNHQKVIFSPYKHPGYDLAVMSLCDHMIISVGTFGWWGGWLAGGSVVYFEGYPKPGSEISKYFVKEDFYPPSWTGMT